MTLLTESLTSAINQLANSVKLTTLVPASIVVLFNLVFIFPAFDVEHSVPQMSLVVLVTIAISYLLWLLNAPFLELLTGYALIETRLGRYMVKRWRDELARLDRKLALCEIHLRRAQDWLDIIRLRHYESYSDLENDPEYREILNLETQWQVIRARCLEERTNHFPPVSEQMMPTKLGNTIAAFENYPYLQYGASPILLSHLMPILDKNGFAPYVEREKSGFDFVMNLMFVTVLLGLECIDLAALFLQPTWLWGMAIAIPLIIIEYHALIAKAVYWGSAVKIGFDLYRHDLSSALHMRQAGSFEDEKHLWENVSDFLARNQPSHPTTWDYDSLRDKEEVK